jgi:hypothetical protein
MLQKNGERETEPQPLGTWGDEDQGGDVRERTFRAAWVVDAREADLKADRMALVASADDPPR